MATVILSAAGAAVGGSIGGTFAGLSSVAIGRAVGATLGKVIDQRLMGQGSDIVEHGRVDRFRLTNAGEGEPIGQLFGRMRLPGQVIWASDFAETTQVTGGGKGAPSQPETREYSYTVSLAIALCEGVITRVGRVWADGEEIAPDDLNMRVYQGTEDQLPDPTIEAIEGAGLVPAYRGTAYVVFENLPLGQFGNRVPQFTFEVVRPEQPDEAGADLDMSLGIRAVAMIPGTGEYALATTPVNYVDGLGGRWSANINTPAAKPDFVQSMDALGDELPNCNAASLIVSWFGDDLRCGDCLVQPKIEKRAYEGENMPWVVSGLTRTTAEEIAQSDGRPIYGGTPSDQSVVEAIAALREAGKSVMFYPFILMDQQAGNGLPDPYSDAPDQPALPWRGRITLSEAPGRPGSPDGTFGAHEEVSAFFGSATADDFTVGAGVLYTGPDEWSFSRFILHCAGLCKAAGGVDAFCIGSEMRGMTWIRGIDNRFVFVERLRFLAGEVRRILGPDTKISYASDWSEYFGYQPQDGSGDRFFHLDPLWADDNIDFIGIDNYMPLSDWRDGEDHADAAWGDIYDLDYLRSNVMGGEGHDWYYHSSEAREAQIRTPITDQEHDEPWIWRYKDIRSWWLNGHYERVGGVRSAQPTSWEPRSKPIWFTEYGCAAIDKGTNQPNKFVDPKSSESQFPRYSNGARDDLLQKQYYRAMLSFWADPANNPASDLYEGAMIDMTKAFAWAWDTRPYPFFPNAQEQWSDGPNYVRGHWINGRTSSRSLASVVGEICTRAGLEHFETSGLYGYVRGYQISDVVDARSALQPLMLRYAFDAVERDGLLRFVMRTGRDVIDLDPDCLAISDELDGTLEYLREADAEMAGRVRLRFSEADADFDAIAEEAILADEATHSVTTSEIPLSLTRTEGRAVTERWLTEARVARSSARFALPPSMMHIGAGEVVRLPCDEHGAQVTYRIDRAESGEMQMLEGVRIDPAVYEPSQLIDELPNVRPFVPPVPLTPIFMDLPLMTGDEVPHAPHIAVSGSAWPGAAAVYRASGSDGFALDKLVQQRATIGLTRSVLSPGTPGQFDNGPELEIDLLSGTLSSVDEEALLAGANLAAIGDGSTDLWELFQFQTAALIAPQKYLLSGRLRGQLGSDAVARQSWSEGSRFVLLDRSVTQLDLPTNLRRVSQTYRVGPARRGYEDPSFVVQNHAFEGVGLRPYAPCHLGMDDDSRVSWIRRTRIDGDSWEAPDVPLGEEFEQYIVRVTTTGAGIVREELVTQSNWVYAPAQRSADGIFGPYTIEVAQVSGRFGPGSFAKIDVAG
ncbi:MAG: glycoside hydrolase TIM-barrel-like domain-containing protein [Pseudomonadota bacterium]